MNKFKRKQLHTTILLSLFTVFCVLAGLYLRQTSKNDTTFEYSVIRQEDIDSAVARYREHNEDDEAQLVTDTDGGRLKTRLLFYGVSSAKTMGEITSALSGSSVDASFFVSYMEANSSKEAITLVSEAGYEVGVFSDGFNSSLVGISGEDMTGDLTRSSISMHAAYGIRPSSLMALESADENLLYAAGAASFDTVYLASASAELGSIKTQAAAEELVRTLERGTLLAVRLSPNGEGQAEGLRLLLSALSETDMRSEAERMLLSPLSESTGTVNPIYTTERAVSYIFSGVGSEDELVGVLQALDGTAARATFFMTDAEMEAEADSVRRILDAGHEMGIAVSQEGTTADILEQMLLARERLTDNFGYDGEILVCAALGSPGSELCSAAGAGGFRVISADLTATRQEDMRETDAAVVLEKVMPADRGALRRGEIVLFRMNNYQENSALLGKLVTLISRQRNVYDVRPVLEVLDNTQERYTYPVPDGDILTAVRNKIYPGQMTGDTFAEIRKRYIGIDWVSFSSFLPGFTTAEINKLDKTGVVKNNDNMIFLTFDDWGTDATITALLDVLKEHDAKATFFVRTSVVEANPNLLRAIALDGHAIGCHTDKHLPLSTADSTGKVYTSITDLEALTLQEDLVTSYGKLQSIVGDIEVDGQPALTQLFRPPTLAVSRIGLETVFDCGFSYSVSGTYTTQDYNAADADSIVRQLKQYTKSGSVFIMHMSDNSVHTAEALDIYLTEIEQGNTRYHFCTLADALK